MPNRVASIACACVAAVFVPAAIVWGFPRASERFASPFSVPATRPVATTTATGVQTYSCEYDAKHRLHWVFKSPMATLYNADGLPSIRHTAGPSWQAEDGSRVVGHVISQAPSRTPGSIPQLLLEAKSAGAGMLAGVRYVERLDTVGGAAPGKACVSEHQIGDSPYLARYVFWN